MIIVNGVRYRREDAVKLGILGPAAVTPARHLHGEPDPEDPEVIVTDDTGDEGEDPVEKDEPAYLSFFSDDRVHELEISVEDWDAFNAYIIKNKLLHLLQQRFAYLQLNLLRNQQMLQRLLLDLHFQSLLLFLLHKRMDVAYRMYHLILLHLMEQHLQNLME